MKRFPGLQNHLKRAASVMSIVAISVVTTLLVQHFSAPPPAAAQSVGEVRATTFLLVDRNGNRLACVGPGGLGSGNLELWDTAGNRRADFAGDAIAHFWDPAGNVIWQAP